MTPSLLQRRSGFPLVASTLYSVTVCGSNPTRSVTTERKNNSRPQTHLEHGDNVGVQAVENAHDGLCARQPKVSSCRSDFRQPVSSKQLTLSSCGVLELHLRHSEPDVARRLANLGPGDGTLLDRLDRELVVGNESLEHGSL